MEGRLAAIEGRLQNLCLKYEILRCRHKYGSKLAHSQHVAAFAEPQIRKAALNSGLRTSDNESIDKFKETLQHILAELDGELILEIADLRPSLLVEDSALQHRTAQVVECMKDLRAGVVDQECRDDSAQHATADIPAAVNAAARLPLLEESNLDNCDDKFDHRGQEQRSDNRETTSPQIEEGCPRKRKLTARITTGSYTKSKRQENHASAQVLTASSSSDTDKMQDATTASPSSDDDNISGKSLHFKLYESVKENPKKKSPVYDLAWSELHVVDAAEGTARDNTEPSPSRARYLATCGGQFVNIFVLEETQQKGRYKDMQLIHSYQNSDRQEEYYTCVFAGRTQQRRLYIPRANAHPKDTQIRVKDDTDIVDDSPVGWTSILSSSSSVGPQLLCVAGQQGITYVIDTFRKQVIRTLMGHGDSIHDLKVSPSDEWLLLSASADESCRLWNLRTGSLVAVFGGHAGHRDMINTISWHLNGRQFASGGNDGTVKIWELSAKVQDAVATSHRIADEIERSLQYGGQYWSDSALEQFPIFSSRKVHVHYVDCVQFVGDLIVSKATEVSDDSDDSVDNYLRLWYPKIERKTTALGLPVQPPPSDIVLLRTFTMEDANYWIVRFAVDPTMRLLAAGNEHGKVYVWDLSSRRTKPIRKLQTKQGQSIMKFTIRCISFSPDGSMLMVSADDGSVYRWNISLKD